MKTDPLPQQAEAYECYRSLSDTRFLHDPYPLYSEMRAKRVHWNDDVFQGAWILTRYADVDMAMRDPRFSSQRTRGWIKRVPGAADLSGSDTGRQARLRHFQRNFARAMVFLDAPSHTRLRQAIMPSFHPSLIRNLAPTIKHVVTGLLDPLDDCQQFDFIEAVARQLPSRIMQMVLGIDVEDHVQFTVWSDSLASFIGALQPSAEQLHAGSSSLMEMIEFFDELLVRKRHASGNDLISRLVAAAAAGHIRADGELAVQCAMLLFAGLETTRNLLGNALFTLLSNYEQWKLLCSDPGAMGLAIREALRYESPVQYTGRRVACEVELDGQTLRRGELVIALIGAANRDPGRFDLPDTFDIHRRQGSHLSFGSGPHVCIGASLAMLEAEVTLAEVVRRWPGLNLVEKFPQWSGNAGLRGLSRLYLQTR